MSKIESLTGTVTPLTEDEGLQPVRYTINCLECGCEVCDCDEELDCYDTF